MGNRKDVTFKQAQDRTVQTSGNWWNKRKLTNYRTESSTLRGIGGASWNIDQYNIDDLFINFKEDIKYNFTSDWDLGTNNAFTNYTHSKRMAKFNDVSKNFLHFR